MLAVGLAPIAVFSAWELWLRWSWGSFPLTDSGDKNVGLPVRGAGGRAGPVPAARRAARRCSAISSLAFLVLVLVAGAIALATSTARRQEKVAFVLAVLLIPLFAGVIWTGATSFMRASTEAYVLAIVDPARAPAPRRSGSSRSATVATLGVTVASEVVKAG